MAEPQHQDAYRRTRLASERTELAWWRTGFTVIALALGIGRILPELNEGSREWPYVVLGLAFAVYGVALIVYGSLRSRALADALEAGEFSDRSSGVSRVMAAAGALLGVATAILILVG